ncbi:MAG TPA: PA14 domain-containing protein [Polyangiaceae bacterium]|nr:PA14 domain-containing protein [Polyangiaceae bacterium]
MIPDSSTPSQKGQARSPWISRCLATAVGSLASVSLLGVLAFHTEPKHWLLEYYPNTSRTGEPTRAWLRYPELVAHDTLLNGVPDREDFSVRISGCLAVKEPVDLRADLTASARGQLYVDGKLVFDSVEGARPAKKKQKKRGHGKREPEERTHVALKPGIHRIEVDYVNTQGGGSFHLALSEKDVPGSDLQGAFRRPALDGTCAAL